MISLTQCTLERNLQRAAYAYENARLRMQECTIGFTADENRSAVEIGACKPENSASLQLANCRFQNNRGANIRIRGAGRYCVRNAVGVHGPCEIELSDVEHGIAIAFLEPETPQLERT